LHAFPLCFFSYLKKNLTKKERKSGKAEIGIDCLSRAYDGENKPQQRELVQKNAAPPPPPPLHTDQSLTVLASVTNYQKMGRIKHASGHINLLPDLLRQGKG
jgi:hypothetical protein